MTTWNAHEIIEGTEQITRSHIHRDKTAFAALSDRHFVTLIAHELMRTLGLHHVSPNFESLMEATREFCRSWQGFGSR